MIGLLRALVVWMILLTVIYFMVSVYSRSVRREKLEKEFDAGGIDGDRDAYIEAGMEAYRHGLRAKLIWLVYVVPTILFALTVYLVNFQ